MIPELIEDIVKLSIIIGCLYFSISLYVHKRQPLWRAPLERRRFTILLGLTLAVVAVKIAEDVLSRESGAIDRSILLSVHAHIPASLKQLFELITLSGSLKVLLPLTVLTSFTFFYFRRRFEARLLASSVANAAVLVFVLKTLVGRERPSLWQTQWYWGSSFPSGHTLVVSAFATALAICVARIWPASRLPALLIALLWLGLVALSRLVLGVHWPTDVMAAICIGVFIPLAMNMLLQLRNVYRK